MTYINLIKNGEIDFYNSDHDNIAFNRFICIQYMRTKKMKENMIKQSKQFGLFNMEKSWGIIRHIFATNIGAALYLERSKYHIVLLNNRTKMEYITGDQPVINTFSFSVPDNIPPEDIEFYYPLSPVLAILITKKESLNNIYKANLTFDEVQHYNNMIIAQSHEQIYSSMEESLI